MATHLCLLKAASKGSRPEHSATIDIVLFYSYILDSTILREFSASSGNRVIIFCWLQAQVQYRVTPQAVHTCYVPSPNPEFP